MPIHLSFEDMRSDKRQTIINQFLSLKLTYSNFLQ